MRITSNSLLVVAENDNFPWGRAATVVALYNGAKARSASSWCTVPAAAGAQE